MVRQDGVTVSVDLLRHEADQRDVNTNRIGVCRTMLQHTACYSTGPSCSAGTTDGWYTWTLGMGQRAGPTCSARAPPTAVAIATALMVSWNWRKREMPA